jgi:hypothetical protein
MCETAMPEGYLGGRRMPGSTHVEESPKGITKCYLSS